MLKKVAIAGAATALALVGVGGVAYADTAKTNCASHEKVKQHNKGKQLVGGNFLGRNFNGWIAGTVDKGVFCPSLFNGSKFSSDDEDD